jgi:hypothetical protein
MRLMGNWSDEAHARIDRIAVLRHIPRAIREGMWQGGRAAALACLFLGGLLGAVNRGLVGTLIGAASGAVLGMMLGALVGAIVGLVLPQREARAQLEITLDHSDGPFAPGETISGYLEILPETTFRIQGGTLYLVCRGLYARMEHDDSGELRVERDARQYLLQQEEIVSAGLLRRNATARFPFSFTIPEGALPTHSGYACNLRWTLHAMIEVADEKRLMRERELLIEAMPLALPPSPGGYQETVATPTCQLTLTLPKALCAEGDALRADVLISPLESFAADEVVVMLLRIENTPQGDDHTIWVSQWDMASDQFQGERRPGGKGTTYVWLEDQVRLSGAKHLEVAAPERFSCTLRVPTQWRPTLITRDGQVMWKVAAVIARGKLGDVRAFHEVIVHTGSSALAEMLAPGPGFRL